MHFKATHYSLAFLLSVGAISLSGCGGGSNTSSERLAQTVDASKNGVTSVALADNEGSIQFKGSFQFDLIGKDNAGKETNLNNIATWTLTDPTLGSIKNGLFTASGKVGALTLNASYAGLTDSQPVTLTDANLVGITVEHTTGSVDVCKNTQFTAKALFSDGKTYNYPLTWSLADSANASLASFANPAKPDLSTKKSGVVKVVAKGNDNDNKVISSPEFEFTIDKTLTTLAITSDKETDMRQGQTATATVTANYINNTSAIVTPNSTLVSSDPKLATVDATSGLITAVSGTIRGADVDLNASCDDITATLALTILKPNIQSMSIVGPSSELATESVSVAIGDEIDLRVRVSFAETGVTPEIYAGNDVEWIIQDNSFDYDKSKVTIDGASGLIRVDESLSLTQNIELTVQARITKIGGGTEVGSDGNELKDTIKVTINVL